MIGSRPMSPEIRVLRHSFYHARGGRHLRWSEAAPPTAHPHHTECGCTVNAEARPTGIPIEVQQEIMVAWSDCLVVFDEEYSAPWVKFRRAGDIDVWVARGWSGEQDPDDKDYAYFQFHRKEEGVRISIGSPGFGLTGVLFTTLFLGNRVDVSRLRSGMSPSRVVDLSQIKPDQAWLHQGPHQDLMRYLRAPASCALAPAAFQLARLLRQLAGPLLADHAAPVEQLQDRARELLAPAGELRTLLAPTAYHVEETELFQLVGEMEAEATTKRTACWSRT